MGDNGNQKGFWRKWLPGSGDFRVFNLKGPRLKTTAWLFVLGMVGILLILAGNLIPERQARNIIPGEAVETFGARKPTAVEAEWTAFADYEKALAADLASILSQIDGAGAVSVSISLETGVEKIYARNTTVTNRTVEEKDSGGGTRVTTEVDETGELVIVREGQSGNEALVAVKEIRPQIAGVVIVAEGAAASQVKADLTRAAATALAIPAVRVQVFVK
ncbi:MAG: hypothetical protein ACOX8W_05035 [bacterium]|jgi:stage III sporulation protein AG